MEYFGQEIGGHWLEYYEDGHVYLVDGIIVPSITEIVGFANPRKYANVPRDVLRRAAEAGTAVHDAIERLCTTGEIGGLPEVEGFIKLQAEHNFTVTANEVPVILSLADEPIAAGRLDMVYERDGKTGGADIKRTYRLDKTYLGYQLNLYRIAYRQSYGVEWDELHAIHLREEKRAFVPIEVDENSAWKLVHDYLEDKQCKTSIM